MKEKKNVGNQWIKKKERYERKEKCWKLVDKKERI